MDSETPLKRKKLQIRGQVRISSGDRRFSVEFREGRALVDFPSFSQLLHLKSDIDSLRSSVSRLPALPSTRPASAIISRPDAAFHLPEFRLTVRGRSVGKMHFLGSGVYFHLTPFDFITKRMS